MSTWNILNIRQGANGDEQLDAGGYCWWHFEVAQDGEVVYPNASVYCTPEERDEKITEWVRVQQERLEAAENLPSEITVEV